MVSPPVNLDRRGCAIDMATILLDGAAARPLPVHRRPGRDRHDAARRAGRRRACCATCSSGSRRTRTTTARSRPARSSDHSLVLIDYNAYWIESLYDYVLYTGDIAFLRSSGRTWSGSSTSSIRRTSADGLLVNWLGAADYAYIPRGGTRVAYYNAQYVRALRLAASLAGWYGDAQRADRWRERAADTAAAFPGAFWDPRPAPSATRPATPTSIRSTATRSRSSPGSRRPRRRSRCSTTSTARCGGATATRSPTRTAGAAPTGATATSGASIRSSRTSRCSPATRSGADASALELIKREWGFMVARGPGTMWETIADEFGGQVDFTPSWEHGWSSGAAPALTSYVLGVQPTSPGLRDLHRHAAPERAHVRARRRCRPRAGRSASRGTQPAASSQLAGDRARRHGLGERSHDGALAGAAGGAGVECVGASVRQTAGQAGQSRVAWRQRMVTVNSAATTDAMPLPEDPSRVEDRRPRSAAAPRARP